jgi:hypothetical protein
MMFDMNFEILVFRNQGDLEAFVKASDSLITAGITRRVLSQTVLLITKKNKVKPLAWAQYKATGWRGLCGDWVSTAHATYALHDAHRAGLEEHGQPFVEVFCGEDVVIIKPESADVELDYEGEPD